MMKQSGWRSGIGPGLMALTGLGTIVDGIVFLVNNFTHRFLEIGIGPEQVSVGRDQIAAFSPSLFGYISHLHVVLAAFEIALGVAIAALAWYGVRRGETWAWGTSVAAFVMVLVGGLPIHFVYRLATFDHLGLNYVGAVVFVIGAWIAWGRLRAQANLVSDAAGHTRNRSKLASQRT
jgi:hypothetical protein